MSPLLNSTLLGAVRGGMYSKAFKALMVRKMTDPSGPGATVLAEEIGVSISTLYRWVSETDTVDVANVPDLSSSTSQQCNTSSRLLGDSIGTR